MAVSPEANQEDEPGFINYSTDELLQAIYEDYQANDVMPPGIKVWSPWGELIVAVLVSGEQKTIEASFDKESMELKEGTVLPLIDSPKAILMAIRKAQQETI